RFAPAHFQLGSLLMNSKQYDAAIAHFHNALEIDPNDTDSLINLGSTQTNMGKDDVAFESFRRAVEVDPNRLEAQFNLGIQLIKKQRPGEALTHLQKAYQLAYAKNDMALAERIRGIMNTLR